MRSLMVLAAMALLSMPATAGNDGVREVLSVAKMAGACGILDSMINMQATTKMPGGDDFVTRFWNVEAARLGLTVQQLSDTCNDAVSTYGKLWDTAN